jgi:hypothetical protein
MTEDAGAGSAAGGAGASPSAGAPPPPTLPTLAPPLGDVPLSSSDPGACANDLARQRSGGLALGGASATAGATTTAPAVSAPGAPPLQLSSLPGTTSVGTGFYVPPPAPALNLAGGSQGGGLAPMVGGRSSFALPGSAGGGAGGGSANGNGNPNDPLGVFAAALAAMQQQPASGGGAAVPAGTGAFLPGPASSVRHASYGLLPRLGPSIGGVNSSGGGNGGGNGGGGGSLAASYGQQQQQQQQQKQQHADLATAILAAQQQAQRQQLAQQQQQQQQHGGGGGAADLLQQAMMLMQHQQQHQQQQLLYGLAGLAQSQAPHQQQQLQQHDLLQAALMFASSAGGAGTGVFAPSAEGGGGVPGLQPPPQPSSLAVESSTVKIRGLPFRATPTDILSFFDGYGYLAASLQLGVDALGRPSGEAWLSFTTPGEALRAVRERNRHYLGARYLELSLT